MVRRVLISTLLVLAMTSAAWAQSPKVEVAGLFGYTLSDGVSGEPYKAGDGNTYDRVDLKDSMNYGLAFGVFVGPKAQIGFLWRRQPTTVQVAGPSKTTDVADMNIDGYHVYGAYYFGDPDGKVRPYILLGLGATNYGGFSYQTSAGTQTTSGNAQFSSTWGAGVKFYPSPKAGLQFGVQWTPTYIKSDPDGWWCGWYGCYVVSDAQYSNQFEFIGGVTFRF